MLTFIELLEELGACEDARIWASDKSFTEAYNECERGDWLMWLYHNVTEMSRNDEAHRQFILVNALCANTTREIIVDPRITFVIDIMIDYGKGLCDYDKLWDARETIKGVKTSIMSDACMMASVRANENAAIFTSEAMFEFEYARSNDSDKAHKAEDKNRVETAKIVKEMLPIDVWNVQCA